MPVPVTATVRGENGGERVLFISDVNVTGFRQRHGEHEAEMMQPRFLTQRYTKRVKKRVLL